MKMKAFEVICPLCDLVLSLPVTVERSSVQNGTLLVDVAYDSSPITAHFAEHPVPDYIPDDL